MLGAIAVMAAALAATVLFVLVLEVAHDRLKEKNAGLTDRYIEVVGRVSALVIGTFAIEMIMDGSRHGCACAADARPRAVGLAGARWRS